MCQAQDDQAVAAMMAMLEALADLAARPEAERRAILVARLDLIYGLPESRAEMLMAQLIQALAELPPADADRVAASRLAVLAGYPPAKRGWLMERYRAALARFPEEVRLPNERASERALAQLAEGERRAIAQVEGPR